MAQQGFVFQRLHPETYLARFLDENVRPDGRAFTQWREISINTGSISTAYGSSLVRLGNTTVVCGVKAEICQPDLDSPGEGFLVPNIDLPALCSPRYKPGPPTEEAQILSSKLHDILLEFVACCPYITATEYALCSSEFLPLSSLCIEAGSAVWCIYVDAICINHDGNAFDAGLVAMVAALLNTSLPQTMFDADSRRTTCSRKDSQPLSLNRKNLPNTSKLRPSLLVCAYIPPCNPSHFFLIHSKILADPSSFEEPLYNSTVTIVQISEGCSLDQSGDIDRLQLDNCIALARERSTELRQLLLT
ncbi:ribosomal protein S5 domain 2-type protein [Flagelloscypha sp. PMI_526]|nr:ribosomal protein S5 domain 2-type protein [Flagelloscypha sp. PMI_526]